MTAAAGAAVYVVLGEPYWLRLVTYEIRPHHWPAALDGLTVVQLSDLHGRRTAFRHPAVQQWLAEADLIAVTGDLYSGSLPREWLAPYLADLPADRTRYVSGNHDYRDGRLHVAPWRPASEVLLDNRWEVWRYHGTPFVVAGVPDLVKGRPDWAAVCGGPKGPAILLSHRPDAVLRPDVAERFHLVLSGHTHGGQVALPGFGPILKHSQLPRKEAAGLTERQPGHYLVVSRGLGTSELPVRFFSRPEVIRVVVRVDPVGTPSDA